VKLDGGLYGGAVGPLEVIFEAVTGAPDVELEPE